MSDATVSLTPQQMAVIRKYVASTPDGRIHDFKGANLPTTTFDGTMPKEEWDDLCEKLNRPTS